ncbi:MAG: hypothetical protein ABW034_12145 [Steroidobacteraceae bacterium]
MTALSTLRTAALSGAAAGVLSAATSAAIKKLDLKNGVSASSNPGRWLSRHGAREQLPTSPNSLAGVITQQLKSILWAAVYGRVFRRQARAQSISQQLLGGAASAATAYLVDYALTSKRTEPRFERHSSSRGKVATYAAVGVGLALLGVLVTIKGGQRERS